MKYLFKIDKIYNLSDGNKYNCFFIHADEVAQLSPIDDKEYKDFVTLSMTDGTWCWGSIKNVYYSIPIQDEIIVQEK